MTDTIIYDSPESVEEIKKAIGSEGIIDHGVNLVINRNGYFRSYKKHSVVDLSVYKNPQNENIHIFTALTQLMFDLGTQQAIFDEILRQLVEGKNNTQSIGHIKEIIVTIAKLESQIYKAIPDLKKDLEL